MAFVSACHGKCLFTTVTAVTSLSVVAGCNLVSVATETTIIATGERWQPEPVDSAPILRYTSPKTIPFGSVNVGNYWVDRYKIRWSLQVTWSELRGEWNVLEDTPLVLSGTRRGGRI